ncbi:MAG: hypothetical protein V4857_28360 [Pseudomonadota bacterium]
MKTTTQLHSLQLWKSGLGRRRGLNALFDCALGPLGSVLLVVGALAAVGNIDGAADYAVAAGVLCHFVNWFDGWWRTAPSR